MSATPMVVVNTTQPVAPPPKSNRGFKILFAIMALLGVGGVGLAVVSFFLVLFVAVVAAGGLWWWSQSAASEVPVERMTEPAIVDARSVEAAPVEAAPVVAPPVVAPSTPKSVVVETPTAAPPKTAPIQAEPIKPEASHTASPTAPVAAATPEPTPEAKAPAAVEPTPARTEISSTVDVKLLTSPPALQVIVDGQERGRTPTKLALATGTHSIIVSDGAESKRFDLNVTSGMSERWCYRLATGTLGEGACAP